MDIYVNDGHYDKDGKKLVLERTENMNPVEVDLSEILNKKSLTWYTET